MGSSTLRACARPIMNMMQATGRYKNKINDKKIKIAPVNYYAGHCGAYCPTSDVARSLGRLYNRMRY